jgi:hypothetical protein
MVHGCFENSLELKILICFRSHRKAKFKLGSFKGAFSITFGIGNTQYTADTLDAKLAFRC